MSRENDYVFAFNLIIFKSFTIGRIFIHFRLILYLQHTSLFLTIKEPFYSFSNTTILGSTDQTMSFNELFVFSFEIVIWRLHKLIAWVNFHSSVQYICNYNYLNSKRIKHYSTVLFLKIETSYSSLTTNNKIIKHHALLTTNTDT